MAADRQINQAVFRLAVEVERITCKVLQIEHHLALVACRPTDEFDQPRQFRIVELLAQPRLNPFPTEWQP